MNLELNKSKSIEELWLDLEKYVTEWKLEKEPMIRKAFDLAVKLHSKQKRESGEDYVTHPIWVAKVVAQLGIGRRAIVAALLHDTVEDCDFPVEEIASEFDGEVASLVGGLTEVKKKTHAIEVEMHKTDIEVFRRFLFSSVNDVRVLVIRIVDKLHNGLTVNVLCEERKIKYARRNLGIYSPVAEYVGLHYFKRILDDIAFKILYPKESEELEKELSDLKGEEIKALSLINSEIEESLKINHIQNYEITGRIKSLYSTFLKIKKRGREGVKDRVGIRILLESVADCYAVLGILHSKFIYLPDEFNDYISNPKPNGYRSIQTTIRWEDKLTLEVQIRTKKMHEFNEFGPASHIAYKQSKEMSNNLGYEWVKSLIKWQKGDSNVNNYRINVLSKYIYVFTPKGDTIQLPNGATALDFAYRIHTDVGNYCSGAKVNQKMVKIGHELKTGDIVEILSTKKINVNKNWLNVVTTNFAKEHIRRMTLDTDNF